MGEIVEDGVTSVPISGIRRLIAERMSQSHREIPGVHVVEECDVTGTDMSWLIGRAVASVAALAEEYPLFNAHVVDGEILLHRNCHVGIAVDTSRGLVVPVVRDAGRRSVGDLRDEIRSLAERARAGKLTARELNGATMTITSPGKQGGILATPLINPPQTAIIGLHRATDRATVLDARIVVRTMMNLTVTFDHRVIDGAAAGNYARALRTQLEARSARPGAGDEAS